MLYHSCTGAFQLDNVDKREKQRKALFEKFNIIFQQKYNRNLFKEN